MHIIIDFKNTTTEEQVQQYLIDHACTVLTTYNAFDKVYLVESQSMPPVTEIIQSVKNDDETEIKPLVYPKLEGQAFPEVTFSSTDAADWWKIACVKAPNYSLSTQTYERRGNCAVVYLVDSGVDLSHPEFEFATISNLWSFNGDFVDTNSHGTALASLLCGKTCGLSDPVVKSVKIFHSGTTTRISHFLGALDAIVADLPNNTNKLSIVNMSWAINKDAYLEEKIRILLQAGVVVVASSGNSGVPIENTSPASMLDVFTVGSFDESLKPSNFSNYSGSLPTTQSETNYGALDCWAPGSNIRVAMPNGSYGISSGTSLSAAIHSSAVAYNAHLLQLPSGVFPTIALQHMFAAKISAGKKDLLNLSDQKYVNSVNVVTVFHGEPDGYNSIVFTKPDSIDVVVASGENVERLLAPAYLFKSIVLNDLLPDGLRLEGLWILGTKLVSEELVFSTTAKCKNQIDNEFDIPLNLRIIPTDQIPLRTSSSLSEDYVVNFVSLVVEEDLNDYNELK